MTDDRRHLELIALPNCMHYLARLIGALPLLEQFDCVDMLHSIEMCDKTVPINPDSDEEWWFLRVTWRRTPLPDDRELVDALWETIVPKDWYWQVEHVYEP